MRYLLALLIMMPVWAQEQAAQAPAAPAQAPAAQTAAAPAKAEAQAQSPAPSTEEWFTGSIDFGYRWLTDVRGNFQTYRSVVDLGEGPKLFGLDFTLQDPKKRVFDRVHAWATTWGGDPYSTAHVDARKAGIYDFNFDYRNIAYFNALPSFANPSAPGGFDEQSFDLRRKMWNASIDLLPGKRIVPYLAFERSSGSGRGVATWVPDANNEYAVPTLLRDEMNNYRGGVRFEYNRFHVTLEQGGTTYKDDDQDYENVANRGDRTSPLLGQTLQLNNLRQVYGIRGDSIYERFLVTATPVSWLNLSGQFLYSQPKTDVHYFDASAGNFVALTSLLAYSGQNAAATGTAKQPHATGNAGFEMRPFRRFRILEAWTTDRYHDAGFGLLSQQILGLGSTGTPSVSSLATRQVVNYNQQEVDLFFDATSKLTIRGGYRYVWGDATVVAGQLSQSGNFASGTLQRHVAIAGVSFRPWEKLSANLEYEGASSDHVYFRTSLNDYNRVRARARYQLTGSLGVQANLTLLNNQNPAAGVHYDFQIRDNAFSVYWTPNGGKRMSVTGEYDRSTVHSNITYLSLPFLNSAISDYRENAHTATTLIDLVLPGYAGRTPRLTAGGSLFISNGSRPERFYEPVLKLSLPLEKHVSWNTEWRWYGLGEQFYLYEGFRTHVFMTGLRLTR